MPSLPAWPPVAASKHYGATADEWASLKKLAKLDLLPVVSNPDAVKGERTKMRALGKTPSLYIDTRDGPRVIGFTGWTDHESNAPNIEKWSKEPDYGVCVQTREVRALDLDLPNVRDADRAEAIFLREVGLSDAELPARVRRSSPRRILAFVVTGLVGGRRGYLRKGSFRADEGLVEFLATGQQFIAAGTHPSGDRYEWRGGLPKAWPEIDWEDVKRAFLAIYDELGVPDTLRGFGDDANAPREGALLEDLDVADPVAEHLIDSEWETYGIEKGMLYLACPWKDNHSSDNGETETAWLLAGTNKYRNGHFACRHTGCDGHSDAEFLKAVGYRPVKASEFEDLTRDDGGVDAYLRLAPGASAKSKELKAELATGVSLPGFVRDSQGRIETCLENLYTLLTTPHVCGCYLAYDNFRGELMIADKPGAWSWWTATAAPR